MKTAELKKFRNILTAHQGELKAAMGNRGGLAIEANSEVLDQIQQSSDRELTIGNLERESRQLREVQAALDRIRLGDFGVCPDCGQEIGMKRLAAVPWAQSCIVCQTAEDRAYQHPGSAFDEQTLMSQGAGF